MGLASTVSHSLDSASEQNSYSVSQSSTYLWGQKDSEPPIVQDGGSR